MSSVDLLSEDYFQHIATLLQDESFSPYRSTAGVCPWCGKRLSDNISLAFYSHYCSEECNEKLSSQFRKEYTNVLWQFNNGIYKQVLRPSDMVVTNYNHALVSNLRFGPDNLVNLALIDPFFLRLLNTVYGKPPSTSATP